MKNLPSAIEVIVTSDQNPREGVLIKLMLGMIRKNSYSYILGPTNSEGKAQIQKCELLSQADKSLELALMDYLPLESGYTGEIEAKVMNKKDIDKAIEAYEIYGPCKYPERYIEILKHAITESMPTKEIKVEINQA